MEHFCGAFGDLPLLKQVGIDMHTPVDRGNQNIQQHWMHHSSGVLLGFCKLYDPRLYLSVVIVLGLVILLIGGDCAWPCYFTTVKFPVPLQYGVQRMRRRNRGRGAPKVGAPTTLSTTRPNLKYHRVLYEYAKLPLGLSRSFDFELAKRIPSLCIKHSSVLSS